MTRFWKPRRRGSELAAADPLPLPAIERFVPTPIDRAALDGDISARAMALGRAMDEGTGHVLDNFINATAAEWEADVRGEYGAYRSRVRLAHAQAEAAVKEEEIVYRLAVDQLGDTRIALDAARFQLAGRHAAPSRDVELSGTTDQPEMFEPADWRDADHADASLIAGPPRGHRVHLLALTVAACADVGAFYQVVARTLQTGVLTIWLVVLGFSATVLYLAHICGVMLRDRKAKARWIGRPGIISASLAWTFLGLAAFMVRLFLPSLETIDDLSSTGQSAQATPSAMENLPGALIFLSLYIGTGLVAGAGAYLTHNPLRDAYAKAQRAYRRRITKAAASANRLAQAKAVSELYAKEQSAAQEILELELTRRRAWAERLKQLARIGQAQQAADPAVTGAIFEEDHRRHDYSSQPYLTGEYE